MEGQARQISSTDDVKNEDIAIVEYPTLEEKSQTPSDQD